MFRVGKLKLGKELNVCAKNDLNIVRNFRTCVENHCRYHTRMKILTAVYSGFVFSSLVPTVAPFSVSESQL